MNPKLNKVVHDPRSATVYIALRPKSQRRPEASLEYPGKVVLDLDAEGDVYGVRLLGVAGSEVASILRTLKAEPEAAPPPGGAS
jgi:uncharacterized protein YuzE